MIGKETHARDFTDADPKKRTAKEQGSQISSWQKKRGVFKAAQKSELTEGYKSLGQSMFKAL